MPKNEKNQEKKGDSDENGTGFVRNRGIIRLCSRGIGLVRRIKNIRDFCIPEGVIS